MTDPELLAKVRRALPPRLVGLLESGLVGIEVRSWRGPPHAMTVYRKGSFQFTVLLGEEMVRVADEAAIRGLVRHELGHVFLGHFSERHNQCHLPCNTLAEEAEVNYYVPQEELAAIDQAATRLLLEEMARTVGAEAAQLLAALGARARSIRPQEVCARAGLDPELPPLWRLLHPLLHPMPPERDPQVGPGGGEGRGPCGGIQVEEEAIAEAMGVAAALATSPRGQNALQELREGARSWGNNAGSVPIPWQMPSLPRWALALAAWARQLCQKEWRRRRVRQRPRLDILRATGRSVPDWGRDRRRKKATVTLLVDTSGSMAGDLHYARPAIDFLLTQGMSVRLIAGDVRVTVDQLLCPGSPIPQPIGMGGTDICPLMERAASYAPKGIAVYTDAAIPRWPERPEGAEVLWIVPRGTKPPYGEVAYWGQDDGR
jgi:hypothetical protein